MAANGAELNARRPYMERCMSARQGCRAGRQACALVPAGLCTPCTRRRPKGGAVASLEIIVGCRAVVSRSAMQVAGSTGPAGASCIDCLSCI
jgi:hypothetical protein